MKASNSEMHVAQLASSLEGPDCLCWALSGTGGIKGWMLSGNSIQGSRLFSRDWWTQSQPWFRDGLFQLQLGQQQKSIFSSAHGRVLGLRPTLHQPYHISCSLKTVPKPFQANPAVFISCLPLTKKKGHSNSSGWAVRHGEQRKSTKRPDLQHSHWRGYVIKPTYRFQ